MPPTKRSTGATDAQPGTTTKAPPALLKTFHRNPRKGDVGAIASSLRAHDQYKPITVNIGTHTGRANEVLAGNHTLMAIRDLAERYPDDERWSSVLVHWVDVDDDMTNRIVVADNQTGHLGGFDTSELAALIDNIGTDIESLGFTDADIADLHAMIEETVPDFGNDPFGDGEKPATPRTGPDGLINSKDVNQNKDEYADSATRMIILNLPIAQFVWAQKHLGELRAERELPSNSDLLLALITELTGDTPPAADAEPPAEEL